MFMASLIVQLKTPLVIFRRFMIKCESYFGKIIAVLERDRIVPLTDADYFRYL